MARANLLVTERRDRNAVRPSYDGNWVDAAANRVYRLP